MDKPCQDGLTSTATSNSISHTLDFVKPVFSLCANEGSLKLNWNCNSCLVVKYLKNYRDRKRAHRPSPEFAQVLLYVSLS